MTNDREKQTTDSLAGLRSCADVPFYHRSLRPETIHCLQTGQRAKTVFISSNSDKGVLALFVRLFFSPSPACVLHAPGIMACANGSAVNGVRNRLSNAHRRSNGHSQNGAAGAGAAETAGNGRLSSGHLGNGHVPNEASSEVPLQAAAAAGRQRRASSSSNDSANALQRNAPDNSNKPKKRKSGRKSAASAASPSTTTAATDHQAAQASCADCNSDLTDSEVEVCQNCFGLRKQRKNTDDERCPYPFGFIKKKYLPLWMHEPEYIMSPRPKRKKCEADSDKAQEEEIHDDQ